MNHRSRTSLLELQIITTTGPASATVSATVTPTAVVHRNLPKLTRQTRHATDSVPLYQSVNVAESNPSIEEDTCITITSMTNPTTPLPKTLQMMMDPTSANTT
jgi:hypothetical protein